MLENGLIEHCASTLAGIKSASLFNYYFSVENMVLHELKEMNQKLNPRGVYVEPLLWKNNSVLIYTYRKTHLERDLQQDGVLELLTQYGYSGCDVESCLAHLKKRLFQYDCFPHEIGIFLGYPLLDVIGFINHKGKNCKCCGLWKVYCNESETKKLFEKLKKCSNIYLQVFAEGRSITQMTVSA